MRLLMTVFMEIRELHFGVFCELLSRCMWGRGRQRNGAAGRETFHCRLGLIMVNICIKGESGRHTCIISGQEIYQNNNNNKLDACRCLRSPGQVPF